MSLPNYFPFMHGEYDVKAGITALNKDVGNGSIDRQVFQIDEQFDTYRAASLCCALSGRSSGASPISRRRCS